MQNVSAVLQSVTNWHRLRILPYSKNDQLTEQHISEQEKKNVVATYYIQTYPGTCWEYLADRLYGCDEQIAVEAVRNYWQAPRGTVAMVTE